MTIETILERNSTKTGSLNWQPSTLKIVPAVQSVFGEKQVFSTSQSVSRYHIKHCFGTTSAHSTVPMKEQKNKKKPLER